jgi:hypothetical protein
MQAMRGIEEVVKSIARILGEKKVDYVIVGGIAVSAWGNIRTTRDVDMILLLNEEDADELAEALKQGRFSIQAGDIIDALKQRSHFTIFDELSEYHIDAKGIYSENDRLTLNRRRKVRLADFGFYVASPEDLIANKLLVGSEQDVQDAGGIYVRQLDDLDMAYLEERCKKLGVYEELFAMKKRVERAIHEDEKKTTGNIVKVGGMRR